MRETQLARYTARNEMTDEGILGEWSLFDLTIRVMASVLI